MSDTAVATIEQPPTNRQLGARNRSAPKRVTGRLKRALDLMTWGDGERAYLTDSEAAVKVGMNVISIRVALQQAHVLAYYKAQREVLRARESPANIHRLREIRDAANNMPAVQAIKALEQLPDDNASTARGLTPGFVVQIVNVMPASAPRTIEHAAADDCRNPAIPTGYGRNSDHGT